MTKIEAIDKAIGLMEEWKNEHDYCLSLSKSYPAVKKEFDEIVQAQLTLDEIKEFLETG